MEPVGELKTFPNFCYSDLTLAPFNNKRHLPRGNQVITIMLRSGILHSLIDSGRRAETRYNKLQTNDHIETLHRQTIRGYVQETPIRHIYKSRNSQQRYTLGHDKFSILSSVPEVVSHVSLVIDVFFFSVWVTIGSYDIVLLGLAEIDIIESGREDHVRAQVALLQVTRFIPNRLLVSRSCEATFLLHGRPGTIEAGIGDEIK